MSSYNLIPFTDLTAVGFTGTVSTTAFTVDTATVTEAVFANDFVTTVFPTTQPMFTFADDTGTGIFSRIANTLGYSLTVGLQVNGTTVVQWNLREGGSNGPFMWLGSNSGTSSQSIGLLGGGGGLIQFAQQNGNFAGGFISTNETIVFGATTVENTMIAGAVAGNPGFSLFSGATTSIYVKVGSGIAVPSTIGSVWIASETDNTNIWHFARLGLLQQATTAIGPSTARSLAHVNNLISGITTVFVTLPTSAPGLKYTVSNARAVANTVVVNPRAADTLRVFGLTKAAGASVSGSAPFASITFHCLTSTVWLATKQLGTWT